MSTKPKGVDQFERTLTTRWRFNKTTKLFVAIKFDWNGPTPQPILTEDLDVFSVYPYSYIANCILTIDGKGNHSIDYESNGIGPVRLVPEP